MQRYEYLITAENRLAICDKISEQVSLFCGELLKKNRDTLRFRLTVEECLLGWLTEDSVGHNIALVTDKKRLRAPTITLIYDGPQYNPYESEEKKIAGEAGFSALRILGLAPTYTYIGGENTLRFDVNPSTSTEFRNFLFVFLLAIFVGIAGIQWISPSALTLVSDTLLTPVYDLLLNILSLISGPLIFLSVIWGIFNIGDAMSFNKIGKSVIFAFIRNDFIVCLVGVAAIPLFGLSFRSAMLGESYFSNFVTLITNCVPGNIVGPFSDGNTLQIIFLAIVVGIGMLVLGKKVSSLSKVIEQANLLLQHLLAGISKLVPILIFVVIVTLFWANSFDVLLSAWKFFVILVGGTVAICLVLLLITCLRYKISLPKLMKKINPSVVVATLTACTTATLETSMDICSDKLGIKRSLVNFGVPLGMVIQNPINCFSYFIMTLFCASTYGVECSVVWYISALICCIILAIATPPIPGGGIVVFTMLFLQLGIPLEAIAIVSAMNMIADFLTTGGDVLFLFPSLIRVADKSDFLDLDCLRK